MAVYNIFASADATLYSLYPVKNTGRDPILEVSVKNSQDGTRFLGRSPITENPYYNYDLAAAGNYSTTDAYFPGYDIRRSVLQFSDKDITLLQSFANQSVSGAYQANLQLFLASAQNLSTTYSLDILPLSQSWCMGTGQYAQVPQSVNGVSWVYTCASGSSEPWLEDGFVWGNIDLPRWENATSIWNYEPTPGSPYYITGGGSWNNIPTTQSFGYMSNKDINANITNIMTGWFSGSIPNNGLLVKHPQAIEENPNSYIDLKYFSVDTHTIYPPTIQFKWDDSYYYPQSYNYVLSDQITITLANNPGQFPQGDSYKMRLSTRLTYPPRRFTTSSVYLTDLILAKDTLWGLQDVKTGEMIVDFDDSYTKVSCDSVGNYFNLHTSGLEINRFYRVLIRTKIYSTTFGPLSLYDNSDSIYDALSRYSPGELELLPAEVVTYSGQNLTFKIVA
jgi:hypothetical protein